MKGNWLCTLVKPNLSKEGGMVNKLIGINIVNC